MIKLVHLPSFEVIGREGSTKDGDAFMKDLREQFWDHYREVRELMNIKSPLPGIWGLMSDFSGSFKPWSKNYTEGLYLFGLEVNKGAVVPPGWSKWTAPEADYLVKEVSEKTYGEDFAYMAFFEIPFEGYKLAGAAYDYFDPKSKKMYIYFPVVPNPLKPHKEKTTDKIAGCGCHCAYCFFTECEGCLSKNDFCSLRAYSKDHKCPNLECAKEKGLKACYECKELKDCKKGIYAQSGNAKAGALFIQRHGLDDYEEAIKLLLDLGEPYYMAMERKGGDEAQVAFLEETLYGKKS